MYTCVQQPLVSSIQFNSIQFKILYFTSYIQEYIKIANMRPPPSSTIYIVNTQLFLTPVQVSFSVSRVRFHLSFGTMVTPWNEMLLLLLADCLSLMRHRCSITCYHRQACAEFFVLFLFLASASYQFTSLFLDPITRCLSSCN